MRSVIPIAILILLAGAASDADATFPGRNGLIAFTSNRAENLAPYPQVYAVRLDGRGRRRVSLGLQGAQSPAWSPDGRTIAFVRYGFWAVMGADPSGADVRVLTEPGYFPAWSPDGTKLAYGASLAGGGLMIANADGTGATELAARTQEDAPAAWSPDGQSLAFLRYAGGDRYGIYSVDVSGRAERKLAEASGLDICIPSCGSTTYPRPSWAPDGTRIAFTENSDGRYRVIVLDTRTLEATVLRSGAGSAVFPAWSPDGKTLAVSIGSKTRLRLVLIDLVRGSTRTVTSPAGSSDLYPTWSQDGRLLAFVRRQAENDPSQQPGVALHGGQVCALDVRTMKVRRVTSEAPHSEIGPPTWSPAGTELAYDSVLAANDQELFVRYPDGSEQQLTHNFAEDTGPAWSADGRKLAFASNRDGDFEIYVSNPQGKRLTQLTRDTNVDETNPEWYPDGTRIAFTRKRRDPQARAELWVMGADGSAPKRFAADRRAWIGDSAWSPDGTALAYEIAYAGGATRVVQLDTGRSCVMGGLGDPVWSPDAGLLELTGQKGGGLGVVTPECRTARSEGVPPFGAFWPPYIWSPDGLRAVQADPRTLDWQPRCTIEGTSRRDVIVGTSGDDVICAFDGNDVVRGGGGHDVIYGGPGDDRLVGGVGADWLFGADGNDVLVARDGAQDAVNGGPGRDRAAFDELDRIIGVELR